MTCSFYHPSCSLDLSNMLEDVEMKVLGGGVKVNHLTWPPLPSVVMGDEYTEALREAFETEAGLEHMPEMKTQFVRRDLIA